MKDGLLVFNLMVLGRELCFLRECPTLFNTMKEDSKIAVLMMNARNIFNMMQRLVKLLNFMKVLTAEEIPPKETSKSSLKIRKVTTFFKNV
jgi:hypothetical protein